MRLPLPAWLKGITPAHEQKAAGQGLTDHVIIVGFGVNGRHMARVASTAGIPHIIIELNPETVHKERAAGLPVFYGDASQPAVLEWAGLKSARVIVVAISDPSATRMVVATARKTSTSVYIIARTRFTQELPDLLRLGANDVVSEEFETSVEIFTRVLARYAVPHSEIDSFIEGVRADGYKMLRSVSTPLPAECRLAAIPEMELASVGVERDAPAVGKTLADLDLRRRFGITVLAVKRSDRTIANPGSDFALAEGDVTLVIARHEDLMRLGEAFGAPVS
jgi:CPA2 family monovalent cation:H+ antiporter-2